MSNLTTYCKWTSTVRGWRQLCRSVHMGRVVPEIDPDLGEKVDAETVDPKRLVTRRKFGFSPMPAQLHTIVEDKLSRYSDKQFRSETLAMIQQLQSVKLPDDSHSLEVKKSDIKTELIVRDRIKVAHESPDGLEIAEDVQLKDNELKNMIQGILSERSRTWRYFNYDERAAMMYMATRMAPNFACVKTVMSEIRHMDPSFKPRSVLDFGSGMGTTILTINEVWPNEVNECLNVDISKDQQYLCEYLLRGGRDDGEPIQNVFHRQYLPSSTRVKYDMVVAAFSMLELPNRELRAQTIENLWEKTNDLLVIVERGNKGGFEIINEARNFILDMAGHDVTKKLRLAPPSKPHLGLVKPEAHVLAPCAHEFICPRGLMTSKKNLNTCRFRVFYEPLSFGMRKPGTLREDFSYVVLRKRPRDDEKFLRWPRIVEHGKRGGGMVIHRLCCPNGDLAECVVTKAKYGNAAYKVAKASKWGDVLPVKIKDTYEVKSHYKIKSS